MKSAFLLIALAFFFMESGCAGRDPYIAVGIMDIAVDSEHRLHLRAREETEILDRSGQLYEDPQLEQYVNGVAGKLSVQENGQSIFVKVLKNPGLTAFAYPTGKIYIYTGLLAALDNEAQLAAVMGHEISHVLSRHLAREFTSKKRKSAEDAGSLRGILTSASCYSRQLETEADTEGLRMMALAGYDPNAGLKMLEYLQREIKEEKIKERRAYSDHPAIQDRIKNMTRIIAKEYAGRGGITNEEAYARFTTRLLMDNAELDLKRGNYASALRALDKYLARKTSDARAYFLLGEVYREGKQEDEEKARTFYRKAITLSRNYADPYRSLGILDCKKGNGQDGKKNLRHYMQLKPDADDREYIRQYMNVCK